MAKKFLLILFLLGIGSSYVSGQVAITGQIRGVVTDTQDASMPNVAITAKSPAMMAPRKIITDAAGSYLFDLLCRQATNELTSRQCRIQDRGSIQHHHLAWIHGDNQREVTGRSVGTIGS